jgi:hypothetical protein
MSPPAGPAAALIAAASNGGEIVDVACQKAGAELTRE